MIVTTSSGYKRPDGLREWYRNLPSDFDLDGHRLVDDCHLGIGWAEPIEDPLPRVVRNHRSGTCFDVESTEMRAACVDPLRYHLGADVVVHEVRHQQSAYHTDLVYADVQDDELFKRADMTISPEPLHDPLQRFRVWWYVHEYGPLSRAAAVENGRYADPSKNRRHVEWLLDNGYLGRTAQGYLVAAVPPKIADLHAVELKRRDWETALEQADRANRFDGFEALPEYQKRRYGYADYRWVALDAGAIGNALDHREAFREHGVGLLAIAEGGAVIEHIEAEHDPRRPYTRDRAYVESQVWERIDLEDHGAGFETDDVSGKSAQPSLTAFDGGSR